MTNSVIRQLAVVGVLAWLAGCVTTTESVFTDGASPEEAQQKRVALARQYIGEGNWDDAKRNLAIAVEIDDKNAEVYEALLRQGVIARPIGNYGLPNHLRVTVGLPQENQRFVDALQVVLNKSAG